MILGTQMLTHTHTYMHPCTNTHVHSHTDTAHTLSHTCTHSLVCTVHTYMHTHTSPCTHRTLCWPHADRLCPSFCWSLRLFSSGLASRGGCHTVHRLGAQVTSIYCLTLLGARSPTARRWQDWSLLRTLRESLLQASLPGL